MTRATIHAKTVGMARKSHRKQRTNPPPGSCALPAPQVAGSCTASPQARLRRGSRHGPRRPRCDSTHHKGCRDNSPSLDNPQSLGTRLERKPGETETLVPVPLRGPFLCEMAVSVYLSRGCSRRELPLVTKGCVYSPTSPVLSCCSFLSRARQEKEGVFTFREELCPV